MICFVILHYQAVDETVNSINSIKKLRGDEFKIIIVDNASPNQSGKFLQEQYVNDTEVEVFLKEENLGFAKGNNAGFQEAKKYDPDYIVVMNNDVIIEQEDFAKSIEASYKKYSFDVLGPDILSVKTGLHQNPQRDTNYTLDELEEYIKKVHFKNEHKFLLKVRYFLKRSSKTNLEQKTDYLNVHFDIPLHGACYIYSKRFIEKYENCFYPETFMYFESYILHYLGEREGLKFVYDPTIQVIHHEDVATNQTYSSQYKKSLFVNSCLEDSGKCFLKVMMNENIKLNDMSNYNI